MPHIMAQTVIVKAISIVNSLKTPKSTFIKGLAIVLNHSLPPVWANRLMMR